jgi:hypothetical protein
MIKHPLSHGTCDVSTVEDPRLEQHIQVVGVVGDPQLVVGGA